MHPQVIEGTWEEISRLHGRMLAGHRVEVKVLDVPLPRTRGTMISEGMFPQLLAITEDDFTAAEWHGSVEEP